MFYADPWQAANYLPCPFCIAPHTHTQSNSCVIPSPCLQAKDLANLSTLPKRLIPRLPFFSRESRFTKPLLASASEATSTKATVTVDAEAVVEPATKLATSTLVEPMPRGGTVVRPQGENSVVRAPPRKVSSVSDSWGATCVYSWSVYLLYTP